MLQRMALSASFVGLLVGSVALGDPPASAPADPRFGKLPNTNTAFKPAEYKSLGAWEARRAWLREQVRFVAGLLPEPERTPLNAKIFDKREYGDVTIEKVCFESQPGLYVFGNLYRPVKIEGKIPGIACALGHWEHGRLHQDDSGNYPALGRGLARLGATVLIYDMTGVNEGARQFGSHDQGRGINTPERDLWGITSFSIQTWTSIRVIDFLQSLPEVDPERIGMTGASGGGTQTFILDTVDDRVKAAVPVNMISSTMQGGCACENAPCLRIDANNMDIAACMAPKPMLMISTSGDWTQRTPKVEFPFVRSIYELFGKADAVKNAHFDYPHNYNKDSREAMYPFFAKVLLNRSDLEKVSEGDLPKIDPKELTVWTDETAPKDLLTFDKLVPLIQERETKRIAALAPETPEKLKALTTLVRTGLTHILGSAFPKAEDVPFAETDKAVVTHYERSGRRVECHVEATSQGASSVVLRTAWPVAEGGDEPPQALPAGWEIENFTAFAPRGNKGPTSNGKPRGSSEYFTTFNRVDAAESAYDVLTALGTELQHDRRKRVALSGVGEMGPVCLVARSLVPAELAKERGLRTAIDMNGFDANSDEAYLKQLNLPHIRRIGGLQAVAAVACNGPIWFHNVGSGLNEDWIRAAAKINGVEVRITRERADEKAIMEWLAR